MFSSSGFNRANAYRQVGAHSGVENASPHALIQMLFEGLFQSLNAARGAMERGEIEEKGRHLGKAVRILQEGLAAGLDLDKGGELAGNLKLLYDYSVKQLTHANVHNDVGLVEEVIGVLQPVAQGWKEIGPEGNTTAGA
ncbi:MAG TPA: flagellar export chaperone FliS [Comamonas denitrificans]|jgi:flagellar protein FliS|uniref:flagellar export chaperone FliS n=1 Tax=Comamonas denitrificans TaxID=117506 RepID=UPI001B470340|nr:flagellar export chaperone FliS [Comamonas sp.]MCZ2107423.1 flagellar export chaperone FliS [Burkholderiales bacterium]HRF20657.1 flagellar export chaperone FliS [Comamonas denitrificans]MBP6294059.1 flagellar export chaperone FliS [Comamonas sp.]MBP7932272.1 flagellar export chaperone FliS [Comamonas sp.]